MNRLDEAIVLATRAHAGQADKAGEPYILHPLRVMQAVSPEARVVAVLHDVLEDCDDSEVVKRSGKGSYGLILRRDCADDRGVSLACDEALALLRLARNLELRYETYIGICRDDPLAREVKIADLRDNLSRPDSLPDSLRKRYEKALRTLLDPASTEGER